MAGRSKLFPNQLARTLTRELSPCYLIFGDEPLQRFEAVAEIVAAARGQGFEEVERLYLDSGDDAASLTDALQGMSLFASQRVIVLDMGNGKIGKEMGSIVELYAQQPSQDLVVICHGAKLEKAQQNAKWFKALNQIAQPITITTPNGDRLRNWLRHRALAVGLQLTPDALAYLQEHHEGNLLALAQELEKLALLHGNQNISIKQLHQSLIDQSRFDVFQLSDALLSGQQTHIHHMLQQLKDEGVEPVIVCWALSREITQLEALKQHPQQQSQLFKQFRIWPSRQPLIKRALQQLSSDQLRQAVMLCALLERKVKGFDADPELTWSFIEQSCQLLLSPQADIDWLLAAELS